ncbi:MAG: cytochrome c [Phycisphaerales bacterium]|nr:MAG: cytochrome c [Phycisphaerales bacterium]
MSDSLAPKVLAAGAAVVCLPVILASCQSQRVQYEMKLADTGPPALHAVHGERLEQLMYVLDELRYQYLPPEYETEPYRHRKKAEAAEVAQQLAETAHRIPGAVPAGDLDEEERELFMKLVKKLEEDALRLKEQADRKSREGMFEAMDRLTATCNACHSVFRLQSLD